MRGFFKRPENKNNNLIEQMVDGFSTGIAKGRLNVASLIVKKLRDGDPIRILAKTPIVSVNDIPSC